MIRRDIALQTLRHEKPACLPYFLDMTEETAVHMYAYTGNARFFEDSGSYLAQERNESFRDLGNGKFEDMFGVVWDKGAQEGHFGIVAYELLQDADFGNYVFPEPNEKLIREKCERLAKSDCFTM